MAMTESNVVPLGMNDENLRRRIAELARNSIKVFFTHHALKQMRRRRVLRSQVLHVLCKGRVTEHAHRNIHGNWQCTLEDTIAGDRIKVAAALETDSDEGPVIVITVMN